MLTRACLQWASSRLASPAACVQRTHSTARALTNYAELPTVALCGRDPLTIRGRDGTAGTQLALIPGHVAAALGLASQPIHIPAQHAGQASHAKGYAAVHVSKSEQQRVLSACASAMPLSEQQELAFMPGRAWLVGSAAASAEEQYLFTMSQAYLAWSTDMLFCPQDGTPLVPDHDGKRKVCEHGHQHFPRLDSIGIAAVLCPASTHVLLGRGLGFPPGLVSCLAGFLEPGETLEQGVAREVREEAGVQVLPEHVRYVASQSWPLPRGAHAQLMLGCVAHATSVDIVVDPSELEFAAWVPLDDVAAHLHCGEPLRVPGMPKAAQLPGSFAMAHTLLTHVVSQRSER